MRKRILVMGSANVDLILTVPRFHKPGETITAESLVTAYGGKGANQAVAAKRLGGRADLLAKLGKDPQGRAYRQYLIRNGFQRKFLLAAEKFPTGIALIEVSSGGENRIVVSPGANGDFLSKDLKKLSPAFREAGVFVAQLEIPIESVAKGLRMAQKGGAVTLLNPAPAKVISPEILACVDYLMPNETEAEILTGAGIKKEKDIVAAAGKLLDRGVKNVVMTLGERGVFFKSRENQIRLHAFPVTPRDTTAAGDAFVGAFACGLAEGRPIREILEFANAAGALTTTRLGAQPSLPSREEVEEFMREAKRKGLRGR